MNLIKPENINLLKMYRPAYFDGFDTEYIEFKTINDLHKIDFVKSWMSIPQFHRLSIDDNHLMVELKNGKEWWVIGIFKKKSDDLKLPKWEPKY